MIEQHPGDRHQSMLLSGEFEGRKYTQEDIEQDILYAEAADNAWALSQKIVHDSSDTAVRLVNGFERVYKGKQGDGVDVYTKERFLAADYLQERNSWDLVTHLKKDAQELYLLRVPVGSEEVQLEAFVVTKPEGGFDRETNAALMGSRVLSLLDVAFRGKREGAVEDRYDTLRRAGYTTRALPGDVDHFSAMLGYGDN